MGPLKSLRGDPFSLGLRTGLREGTQKGDPEYLRKFENF